MRLRILLLASVFIVSLALTPVTGFIPQNGTVRVIILNDAQPVGNVFRTDVGTIVTFNMVVKNLSNDTAANFTITQPLPDNADLVEAMTQKYNGTKVSFSSFEVPSIIARKTLRVNYLNITASNFTANIDHLMFPGQSFDFTFKVNMTAISTVTFNSPVVSYYDHWGDKNEATIQPAFNIEVGSVPFIEITKWRPEITTGTINSTTLVLIGVVTIVLAIVGRGLYWKRPIEI